MPELPEVQTTVNGLQSKVLLRTFVDVWSDWQKMVKKPGSFAEFKKQLKGKKIIKVWRRAKNIIFELSDGYSLLVHMKMTGHLLVGTWTREGDRWQPLSHEAFKEKINGFLHVVFFLDNPPSHKASAGHSKTMIALSDVRKFGKIELQKTSDLLRAPEFASLGPEPLEKSFTLAKLKEVLKSKKGKIKQVIMDPNVIAGIGNIYASEALWWAKIHPEKSAAKLTNTELKALHVAIKKVLKAGIDFGGDSFSDYRNVDGQKGTFEGQKRVYQMKGQPCKRCKTPIKRIVVGTRGTFFCPTCQKL